MHSSGERSAEDYTGSAVVIKPFELGAALLATRRDFAHANLVADHLHGLSTLGHAPRSLEIETLQPLEGHLPCTCLGRSSACRLFLPDKMHRFVNNQASPNRHFYYLGKKIVLPNYLDRRFKP